MCKKQNTRNSLGERMKCYESASKMFLTLRTPMIIRIDGRAFHTLLRDAEKPWDASVHNVMCETAKALCKEIAGAQFAYTQSDEISILVQDYKNLNTQPWFGKNTQKIASVSASIATAAFIANRCADRPTFDSRCFVLPREEVTNYFLWRQQDATKNSIQSLARSFFSHKELQGLNGTKLQEKLHSEHKINWNDCHIWQKRGTCIIKDDNGAWKCDLGIPIFSQDREYIEKYVNI